MPKWLIYSVLTVLAWGVWGVFSKPLEHLSAGQTQAFSTLGILPLMLAVAASPDFRTGTHPRRGSLYAFAAGLLVGVGNAAYYHAVASAGAATTVSFTALYPVITVALALLLLREKPNGVQLAGILGSLGAIYLLSVSQPGLDLRAWLVYALAAVVLWGSAGLVMKIATGYASAELATFWFLGAFVPLGAVILFAQPAILVPDPICWDLPARDWLLVVLLGATYGLGNLTLLAAYRNGGKASIVTPLAGLYPVATIPLAIFFFKESLAASAWAGIVLALAAGVALSRESEKELAEVQEIVAPESGGQEPSRAP